MNQTTFAVHKEPLGSELGARAATYLLFARLFHAAPSADLLREIVHRRLLTLAEQPREDPGGCDPAEDPRWPLQEEAIAVEYARVFAVPGEQAVRPYESVYCDTLTVDTSTACSAYFEGGPSIEGLPGFIGGPSATAVREAYRRAGFDLDPATHELPDHLATELEFMGRLLECGELQQAQAFFTGHLNRWVFRVLDAIKHRTASRFYRAVADALAGFLQHEREVLLARA